MNQTRRAALFHATAMLKEHCLEPGRPAIKKPDGLLHIREFAPLVLLRHYAPARVFTTNHQEVKGNDGRVVGYQGEVRPSLDDTGAVFRQHRHGPLNDVQAKGACWDPVCGIHPSPPAWETRAVRLMILIHETARSALPWSGALSAVSRPLLHRPRRNTQRNRARGIARPYQCHSQPRNSQGS